ncbi:peptidoglycan L,D-transpeptidase, YkuD family [Citrifermentans bemidjiense Bem]|uniref:Peptidoglycan L,D-transpeptidase, YkuD family n=1 Tax=Citrifermentans bemidjiense (strain ATCC BAA-1014 / DSM 16622 / JCM 12645 / Bem) TaxID=404380 RepID=B5EIM0_CITBB|nr:L,D-transpeptidase [Citrifermentans bemidjiense]ACH38385.1 peptidoglycan L,D-transpeptidase, YkuD family [Citrifermentans bemidjiense Bem]
MGTGVRYLGRIASTAVIALLLCAASAGAAKLRSLCEINYPSDSRIPWSCVKLKWGDTPQALFGDHWKDVLRFNRLDRRHFLGGAKVKVPKNLAQVRDFNPMPLTYPDAAKEPKFIMVDQAEMFLGAYEYGKLVYSFPIALGIQGKMVPNGTFRIDAADRRHQSNLYQVEEIGRPYPMHYGLRFWVDKSKEDWPTYWIHGRDLPGHPASHGCIGLYDEEMQYDYYRSYDRKVYRDKYRPLTRPFLEDAKTLYQWVVPAASDPGEFHKIKNGPLVLITGRPPS